MTMYIDQILYPVESLGPGKRMAIWLVGCHRGCKGCSNPELWSTEGRRDVSVSTVLRTIFELHQENQIDGFTITGGEPMEQAEELLALILGLRQISRDILVFSGYHIEELLKCKGAFSMILENIAVLVDGAYCEERNEQLPLRGSFNQRVLLLDTTFAEPYADYLRQEHSPTQNMYFDGVTTSVGIHRKEFRNELKQKLREYGVRSVEDG